MSRATTPSQTVGPYLAIGLPWPEGPFATAPDDPDAIRIHGVVLDGAGDPVPDALIETWQADPAGGFAHVERRPAGSSSGLPFPRFRGFARVATAPDGSWAITTCKPGRVPWPSGDHEPPGLQAPHLDVSVFARGLLHRVVTRIYFADEAAANADDPLLGSVDPDRRGTLLAAAVGDGYRLDIRLQGPGETVFFAL